MALSEKDKFIQRKEFFILWLAAGSIFLSFALFFCVIFLPIPSGRSDIANFIIGGVMGSVFGVIISNYYRSKEKGTEQDDNMNKLMDKIPSQQTETTQPQTTQ
jgi:hypothetical protein